jgi:GT2 family glycosyltransferase
MLKKKIYYGSPRITSFLDYARVVEKNRNINKNIQQFIKKYSKDLKPREKKLRPEVIVTCYNQGKFIETALFSIRAASSDIDVTVIDDASPDGSQNQIRKLIVNYNFTFIANRVNVGVHASLNRAISTSKNNLFIILNADDALLRYSINTTISLIKNTKARLVGGGSLGFHDENIYRLNNNLPQKLDYLPKGRMYGPKDACKFQHLNDINLTTSSSTFLRSAWESVNGFWPFKKRVCSVNDRDFEMRVCSLFNVLVIEEPLAFYRINDKPTSIKT